MSKGNPYKHKGGGGSHRVADRAALIEAERVAKAPKTKQRPSVFASSREERRARARARAREDDARREV